MDDCGHKDIDKEHGEDDNYHQFQCGMCLELCFKPIVHACGHLFCFWCVHSAMNVEGISLCPMCRSPYTQFPRICELLHRLLGAAFRKKYEQRRKEIQEMETASKVFSPGALMEKDTDEAVTAADLPCELCSKILHRPVVLNCGHAFCQACLTMPPADEAERPKCPSCAMPQRIIPVQVCLELNDYIRHTFPEESKQRDDEVKDLRSREGSTVVASSSSSSSSSSSCSHSGGDDGGLVLVHCCVGCDGCGVTSLFVFFLFFHRCCAGKLTFAGRCIRSSARGTNARSARRGSATTCAATASPFHQLQWDDSTRSIPPSTGWNSSTI